MLKKSDVIELYKKGYSIKYIAKEYYKFKTKDDVSNHFFKGVYIVTKKSMSMEVAKKEVSEMILQYLKSNQFIK